jgi:hypothetical protein
MLPCAARLRLGGDLLLLQDLVQVADDRRPRHLLQVELQAARQHRHRDALRIGGGEDELQVRRRLLERLQHRIERRLRQHVYFVDDEHLEAAAHRNIGGVVLQGPHLVDAGVGRGVDLDQVGKTPGVDLLAGPAGAAGLGGDAGLAIEALGQDPRQRRLTDAARSGEQVGVVQPLLLQRVLQGLHDMLLPHQRPEIARAPLAGEDLVAHGPILPAGQWRKGD